MVQTDYSGCGSGKIIVVRVVHAPLTWLSGWWCKQLLHLLLTCVHHLTAFIFTTRSGLTALLKGQWCPSMMATLWSVCVGVCVRRAKCFIKSFRATRRSHPVKESSHLRLSCVLHVCDVIGGCFFLQWNYSYIWPFLGISQGVFDIMLLFLK